MGGMGKGDPKLQREKGKEGLETGGDSR